MITVPEFSRTVRVDTLSAAPRQIDISANEGERAALASRFGLVGIDRLEATASLVRAGEEVRANGALSASVTQSCVATGADVPSEVTEDFSIIFRPQPHGGGEEEIELNEGELDVVFFEGGAVDLGEGIAETLALSLDPYPRAADADAALRAAGVKTEEEAAPKSALAGLKDLLEGKKS